MARGVTYTEDQKTHAVDLYTQVGATAAAEETGISSRTIIRWANAAGVVAQANREKTAEARAVAAERVTQDWADFRSREATAAGNTANRVRSRIMEEVTLDDLDASAVRQLAVAYGILVDKAELLSGQATERIEVWAESEVDRELKDALGKMEEVIRNGS